MDRFISSKMHDRSGDFRRFLLQGPKQLGKRLQSEHLEFVIVRGMWAILFISHEISPFSKSYLPMVCLSSKDDRVEHLNIFPSKLIRTWFIRSAKHTLFLERA